MPYCCLSDFLDLVFVGPDFVLRQFVMDCHRSQMIYYLDRDLDHWFLHFVLPLRFLVNSSYGRAPWLGRSLFIRFYSYQLYFLRLTCDLWYWLRMSYLQICHQIHTLAAGSRFLYKQSCCGNPCPNALHYMLHSLLVVSWGWLSSPK